VCPKCGHFFRRDRQNTGEKRNGHATDVCRATQSRLTGSAWVQLAGLARAADACTLLSVLNVRVIAEVRETVTGHAVFVDRIARRNGTRLLAGPPADLQCAKNGHI